MKVLRVTPTIEELVMTTLISCSQPNCHSTFTNIGNYEMHLQRHHKVQSERNLDAVQRRFYCPHQDCIYHITRSVDKHFKCIKYLRQHYQKVHAAKTQKCERCGKGFATVSQLQAHSRKQCGVKFVCRECGWDYTSMEALLTHGRRKGHVVRDDTQGKNSALSESNSGNTLTLTSNQHQETQTEDAPPIKRHCVAVSTDELFADTFATATAIAVPPDLQPDVQLPIPRNIETQTEYPLYSRATSNLSNPVMPSAHLMPPSTHMYTQTYEDVFPDSLLGFTDIQTQTNWSTFTAAAAAAEAAASVDYTTSGVGTCTRSAYDELLVSTETQTSFTQCLLESRTASGDAEEGIYQTQHTQTCDMLLEGLFGGQESDLIGGFQSTYTQT